MIHPTAIVDPQAVVGAGVTIGPYTVIEGPVHIGDGCRIGPHCHILGHTTIGPRTKIHAGAIIGDEPQDVHYDGAVTYTDIGADCTIREYATVHRGTAAGTRTVIGDRCMLMGFVHIAHNCRLHEDVVVANGTAIAGHVEIGRKAFLSGHCLVHQFVRIGEYAMLSGQARVPKDVAPYCLLAIGNRIYGPNTVGLKRAGMKPATRQAIRAAIKTMFFSNLLPKDAAERILAESGDLPEVARFVDFVRTSKRGCLTAQPQHEDDAPGTVSGSTTESGDA